MGFSGKATYVSGASLPELAEDVSDVISIVSPFETPLLDVLGDPLRAATSTHHEWLEDELLPNKDAVDDLSIAEPDADTQFDVANGDRFRVGDQIQLEGEKELMLVTKDITTWARSRWMSGLLASRLLVSRPRSRR